MAPLFIPFLYLPSTDKISINEIFSIIIILNLSRIPSSSGLQSKPHAPFLRLICLSLWNHLTAGRTVPPLRDLCPSTLPLVPSLSSRCDPPQSSLLFYLNINIPSPATQGACSADCFSIAHEFPLPSPPLYLFLA